MIRKVVSTYENLAGGLTVHVTESDRNPRVRFETEEFSLTLEGPQVLSKLITDLQEIAKNHARL